MRIVARTLRPHTLRECHRRHFAGEGTREIITGYATYFSLCEVANAGKADSALSLPRFGDAFAAPAVDRGVSFEDIYVCDLRLCL